MPSPELQQFQSTSQTVPAPIGGWNARDPQERMADTEAITMINIFPDTRSVKIRRGFASHATGMGSGAVQSVAELHLEDGTRKLVAFANSKIYDATSSGAATDITGTTTPTSNKWQTVMFSNELIMVNGADQPQTWAGTGNASDALFTGVSDDSVFIDITVYRTRLYFVEKESLSIWYGGVGSTSGAATEFDLDDVFRRGGSIQAIGTWTRDSGDGQDELFVVVTDKGEIVVYSGTYPGDSSWTKVAHYYGPIPIGRRCLVDYGPELLIITEQGVIPTSSILSAGGSSTTYANFTNKIDRAFTDIARSYSGNFGWQGVIYPRGDFAFVNVPITEDTTSHQYVVNTVTGAWSKFTGINASSWCLHNEKLYFGGMDGVVYEADKDYNDNNAAISVELKCAFNYFGDVTKLKRFCMGKPIVMSDSALDFKFDIDVDFEDRTLTASITTTGGNGSPWDTSAWDTSDWDTGDVYVVDWYSITGVGRAGALRLLGNFKDVEWELLGFQIVFEPGGIL